jgi:hypothetical protein
MIATLFPLRAIAVAQQSPMTPEPMTTTSAERVSAETPALAGA